MGTELASLDAEHATPEQLRDAERLIRRLANRHGCKVKVAPDGTEKQDCPDPAAHAVDAAELSVPLQAIGAVDYPRGAVDGIKTCKQCGTAKRIGEGGDFPENSKTADGYSMTCHACKAGGGS